jgi:hypothetical protein
MLSVPPAPRFRMASAPLVEAVAQVNFPIVARLQSLEGIAPLRDALFDLHDAAARARDVPHDRASRPSRSGDR